jgi:hypothetical protein
MLWLLGGCGGGGVIGPEYETTKEVYFPSYMYYPWIN